jgi:hypothetical protein
MKRAILSLLLLASLPMFAQTYSMSSDTTLLQLDDFLSARRNVLPSIQLPGPHRIQR